MSQISELRQTKEIIGKLKGEGKKIVFTNGCFDILHIGHVRLLREAKKLGDILIVGLNSDRSVTELKGKGHPIIPAVERAELLSALKYVDYVVIFDEPNPNSLIMQLKPDIHVKGGDYSRDTLPEVTLVESYGGQLVIIDEVEEASTTAIVQRIFSTRRKEND